MEITEINMIGDFEAGIKCLKNPSLISRFSPVPQLYSFWKWGALFLAIFSTFTSLLRKIKLLIIRRINYWVSPSKPLFNQLLAGDDDDFDFSDDDEVSSSGSVSDDDDDDDEDEDIDYTSSFEDRNRDRNPNGEDYCVAGSNCFSEVHGQNGSCGLRRRNRFSWSDFSAGKSVVKLWDSFGFALDFEENYADEVSTWDFDNMSNIFGGKGNLPAVSSPVVLSAEMNDNESVVVSAYDARMGRRDTPAIHAEWRPRRGKVVGELGDGGIEKVYINGALTVGDLRNVKSPLGMLTVTDLELS